MALIAAPAWAQEDEVELIPVLSEDEDDDSFFGLVSGLQWAASANVQADFLADSDLPDDRQKDNELRRARLGGLLEWHYRWRLKIGVELADSAPVVSRNSALRDLSVEFRSDLVQAEFGLMVEPFGLLQGSSRAGAFMERPQASGLGPGYGIGAAANLRADRWGFAIGMFGPTRNDVFFGGREDSAITLRVTGVPLLFDDGLIHTGVGLSLRQPTNSFLQFVTIPETILLLGLNTSSEVLLTDSYRLYGAEFATQWGPVLLQSEYFYAAVSEALVARDLFEDGELTFVSPSYTGYYAEAIWAVTGERRDYSVRRGTFSGIDPGSALFSGGFGALEVAVRHGRTDLRDEAGGGERGRVSSVALNWYPLDYLKLMLVGLEIEEEDAQGTVEKARAVQLRVQLHYSVP